MFELGLFLVVILVVFLAMLAVGYLPVFALGYAAQAISPLREKVVYWRYKNIYYQHNQEVIDTLKGYFPYYNRLNQENREKFELRLLIFMDSKRFVPRNGLILTERMKILICASAIQLTFGLSYFTLSHFYTIYVYPEPYFYRYFKVQFKGHVSDRGTIHLSWNNFEKGYLFPDDGVNLGLHELMHALKIYALQHHVDFNFHKNNGLIEKLVQVELVKLKTKRADFLKNRLIDNPDEFIAVCAECFFELPQQFNREIPELYASMKQLLNQDPLNAQNPVPGPYPERML